MADDGTNNGTVPAGTNYRFVQGNFDNVRLTVESKTLPVPEPVEEPKALVNGSFEEPAAQAGFDNVPGWSTSAPAANSGIQVDPNATDGAQTAYLAGGDPAISQMSSLVVEAGSVPELKVDARAKAGAASLKMTLFVEVLGIRMPVATQEVVLTGSMAEYVLRAENTAAIVGSVVGVELACGAAPIRRLSWTMCV